MKKILLSAFVILTFFVYTVQKRFSLGDEEHAVIAQSSSAFSGPSPASSNNKTVSGKYRDGQYTGDVADAYYGYLQVQAVILQGKISDVVFLQYPSDRRTSIQINSQAMPYLKQEAISAQSSNVNIVSGATQSSRAFRVSLASALAKAKI